MVEQTLHVVLGSGQIGSALARHLVEQSARVRVVSRSRRDPVPGAEWTTGDMSDPAFAASALTGGPPGGGTVAYDCMNPPYDRWSDLLLPLGRGALHAAARVGARLVALDNLYVYGKPTQTITEESPIQPCSHKGELRRQLAEERLAAHRRGDVAVALLRAGDFFGPGITLTSIFGDRFFQRALRGRAVECFGDPDQPHAYTYGPDVVRALAALGRDERALGRVWLAPTNAAESTRALVERFSAELGTPLRIRRIPDLLLQALGLFSSMLRANAEMTYQWQRPYGVSDARFRATFGFGPTAWEPAVAATVQWARRHYGWADAPSGRKIPRAGGTPA